MLQKYNQPIDNYSRMRNTIQYKTHYSRKTNFHFKSKKMRPLMYGLIDYTITVTIDKPNWVERVKNSALLVIHTIFIPLQSPNPLKRDFPLSLHNLAGEV